MSHQAHELATYSLSPEDIKNACRHSIDYMAATSAPHIYQFPFPDYYKVIFEVLRTAILASRDFSKLALGFPRGFAKTTFLKFIIIWAVLFSGKRNIVIVCANDKLVKNFIADITDLLDAQNIVAIFGNWRINAKKVTQEELEFRFDNRLIKIAGVGVGSSLRGLVRDGSRPDLIIMDDVQTREDAESDTVSKQLMDWLYGTINFLRSPFGCTYVFLANMYPTPHSMLKHLITDPEWQTYIASAITEDGISLWEDLHPVAQILSDYRSLKAAGKEDIFWAELMNKGDMNTKIKYDPSKLRVRDVSELEYHQGCFLIIDPSGRKKKSDDTAIGVFRIVDGIPYVVSYTSEILTPKQTISKAIELATSWGASLIATEDVAYQETLIFWFEEYLSTIELSGLTIVGINSGGVSKNSGIIDCLKEAQAGEIGFVKETALLFSDQALAFNPLITKNKDDVLDVTKFAKKVISQHGGMIALESPFSDYQEIPLLEEHLTSVV